jgi:uncharacterized phiE125 gp8 family phage protein
MSLVLVTAPTAEPVTLAQVKAQLRITVTTYDDLLNALITAVRMHLEGRDGWLGRALLQQTWDLKLDCFYSGRSQDPAGAAPLNHFRHLSGHFGHPTNP